MIGPLKDLKIIKSNPQSLIMMDIHENKYRYTQFQASLEVFQYLVKRMKISHPSIIKVCKIFKSKQNQKRQEADNKSLQQYQSLQQHQKNFQIKNSKVKIGLLTQYYSSKFPVILRNYRQSVTQDQIINTFEPILQAIQYLIQNCYFPRQISLENIVFTEYHQIKFIDIILQKIAYSQNYLNQNSQLLENKIYEKLANIIFQSLFPKQKTKSWKAKIKIAKKQLSNTNYSFFIKIFQRSMIYLSDSQKTSKIKKSQGKKEKAKNIENINNKIHKITSLYGKQNQIIQQEVKS